MAGDLRAVEKGNTELRVPVRRSLLTDMNTAYADDRGHEYALAAGSPEYALAIGPEYVTYDVASGAAVSEHVHVHVLASRCYLNPSPRTAGKC